MKNNDSVHDCHFTVNGHADSAVHRSRIRSLLSRNTSLWWYSLCGMARKPTSAIIRNCPLPATSGPRHSPETFVARRLNTSIVPTSPRQGIRRHPPLTSMDLKSSFTMLDRVYPLWSKNCVEQGADIWGWATAILPRGWSSCSEESPTRWSTRASWIDSISSLSRGTAQRAAWMMHYGKSILSRAKLKHFTL